MESFHGPRTGVRLHTSCDWASRERTGEHHGGPLGDQQGHHQVPHLLPPQLQHVGVLRLPFKAAVPADVVVGAVLVLLSVILVPLLVVGHQVVQREPVVRDHKVDVLVRLPVRHSVPQSPHFAPLVIR